MKKWAAIRDFSCSKKIGSFPRSGGTFLFSKAQGDDGATHILHYFMYVVHRTR